VLARLQKRWREETDQQKEKFMCRRPGLPMQKIFIQHARWLEANGYKQQATSCKLQAASLTRKNYNVIGVYRRKNYENK
jgi:hypothetical protein